MLRQIPTTFFLIVIVVFCYDISAQKIEFEEIEHDFGTIKETQGPVRHRFRFRNTGDSALVLFNVSASCGCTTPRWTVRNVAPGAYGYVDAEYNPLNRPGKFNKSLSVSSNADSTVYLTIKGFVEMENVKKSLFPIEMGNLRFNYDFVNLGIATKNKIHEKSIESYNDSEKPIRFLREKSTLPDYLTVAFEDSVIMPGRKSRITFFFDATTFNGYGREVFNVSLVTNEQTDSIKNFNFVAYLEDPIRPLGGEEYLKGPVFSAINEEFKCNLIEQGKTVEGSFTLTNRGKSPLKIHEIESTCSCLIPIGESTREIKPGEQVELEFKFLSEDRRGMQNHNLYLYTSDPLKPKARLTVSGFVKKP